MQGRDVLPIPDMPHRGLVTFDAKDPDTAFPPIEQTAPPEGTPNVLHRRICTRAAHNGTYGCRWGDCLRLAGGDVGASGYLARGFEWPVGQ